MSNPEKKCPYHHEKGGVCIKCGWVEPSPAPKCRHTVTIPSVHGNATECKECGLTFDITKPPATKGKSCEHDKGLYWRKHSSAFHFLDHQTKTDFPQCPYCLAERKE